MLEWAHATVPPRMLVEHPMLDRNGRLPQHCSFQVFGGRVAYLHVDQDRDRQPVNLQQQGIPAGVTGPLAREQQVERFVRAIESIK